jgi:bifunctional DNA-binding transcriptional regulator/antitoxin component of YhaV-PrlF toxin-antitoxin module
LSKKIIKNVIRNGDIIIPKKIKEAKRPKKKNNSIANIMRIKNKNTTIPHKLEKKSFVFFTI